MDDWAYRENCLDWLLTSRERGAAMSIGETANKFTPALKRAPARVATRRDSKAWIQDYVTVSVPRPSFLLGLASLWDFGGALTPRVRVNREMLDKSAADQIAADWEEVGRDIASVLPPE